MLRPGELGVLATGSQTMGDREYGGMDDVHQTGGVAGDGRGTTGILTEAGNFSRGYIVFSTTKCFIFSFLNYRSKFKVYQKS